MTKTFYNTNKETGEDLKDSISKAKSQEVAVLKIFSNKINLSASEAWSIFDSTATTPITSIRRAITNLCKKGELFKTDKTKKGIYGKNEHIYTISISEKYLTQ